MEQLSEKIIEELVAIGFAKATDYLSIQDGLLTVKDTDDMPSNAGAAIAAVERSTTGIKVKFYDKLKALEMLGKCLGMFDPEQPRAEDNNLLQAMLESTGKEMTLIDIPEVQPQADPDHDLVEQTQFAGL